MNPKDYVVTIPNPIFLVTTRKANGTANANLECHLEREEPLVTGSNWYLFVGRVLHVTMDERAMLPEPEERMREMGLMYNIRSTVNPMDGHFYGPNILGLLSQAVMIFPDDGHMPDWSKSR
jgi:flavin reductase (DIM6/NTAB) family NADH-FMN oxidoreductase RutF